jgi:hypothetical protein
MGYGTLILLIIVCILWLVYQDSILIPLVIGGLSIAGIALKFYLAKRALTSMVTP